MEQAPEWVERVLAGFGPDYFWGWRWDPVGPLGAGELVLTWKKASSDVGVTLQGQTLRLDNGVGEDFFELSRAGDCGRAARLALYRWQE